MRIPRLRRARARDWIAAFALGAMLATLAHAAPGAATSTRQAASPPTAASARARRLAHLPMVMLWAWERPERLGFVDPQRCGVAYLAATLRLSGGGVAVRPRMQPLELPPGTALVAVARIESDRRMRPALDADQRALLVAELVALAHRPGLAALQIDFDASRSQRMSYRALIAETRAALPDTLPLTMTALASWGLGDGWLSDLAVDEAVPMAFRMGADDRRVRLALARGDDFAPSRCRTSIGFATDEPAPRFPTPRRVYLFHPRSWTAAALREALAHASASPIASPNPE